MDFLNIPGSPAVGSVIQHRARATSMSFHESGGHLFVASESDSRLYLINCLSGKIDQPAIRCERERIHLVEATHHESCALISGRGGVGDSSGSNDIQRLEQRHSVHYLSVYDNRILRKFRGHTDDITNISMSPADDCFLTSSKDRTVRLWNTQQLGAIAKMELPSNVCGNSYAAYDSTGLVFAITAAIEGGSGNYVHLYDARNYGGGAFAEFKVFNTDIEKVIQQQQQTGIATGGNVVIPQEALELSKMEWNSIQFNTSGSQLLVQASNRRNTNVKTDTTTTATTAAANTTTNLDTTSIILDGFEGNVTKVFLSPPQQHTPATAATPEQTKAIKQASSSLFIGVSSCFTPDDATLLSGNNQDGTITCWDIESGNIIKTLNFHQQDDPISCIAANPKYAQFASCCSTATALWIWQ